jgi:hypothetical protein
MVNYKLCHKSWGILFLTMVLHIYGWKEHKWLHQTLQNKDTYNDVKDGMDDVYLFKVFLSFFKSSIPSIIFQFNHCLNKHNHMLH